MTRHKRRLTTSVAAAALTIGALATAQAQENMTSEADHTPMACDRKIPVQDLTGAPKAAERYTIELSVPSLANPYITGLIYGATIAAKDAGVDLSIDSGAGFMDPASQIRQVENAMTKQPDALLINPADPDGMAAIVDDIIANGTPVVDVGTLTSSKNSLKVVQDDYDVGITAAKTLVALLPQGGEGIVQGGPANATWARRQVAGFLDTVKDVANIKVSAVTNQDLVPTEGLQKFTDAAQAHPKVVWINVTNNITLSPYSVPPEFKSAVYIAGSYDATMQRAVKEGVAKAAIPYFPAMVGYFGVATAVAKLNGEEAVPVTCIPSAAITAETVDDPMWQTTNYPPEGWEAPTR